MSGLKMSGLKMLLAFPIAAAVGAGLFGFEKLGPFPFFKKSLTYQGTLFALFFTLYLTIPGGFRENFNTPNDKTGKSWTDVLYFTAVTHSSTGYGDIYPLTPRARALVTMHSLMAFAGAANVIAWA